MAGEVFRGTGSRFPVIFDVEKEDDAEALISYLPYFLGKGTSKCQVLSGGVNSSSSTKPILVIATSAMALVNLQLLFRTCSFLRPNEVTDYKEFEGAPYRTCALPSFCPVDVANCDVVFTHAGFYQCLPGDLFQAVVVYQSNSLEVAVNTNIVIHFQAQTILMRTYDAEVEAISLVAMLRERMQLPDTEGPMILHAGFTCRCPAPDPERSRGDQQLKEESVQANGAGADSSNTVRFVESETDSANSKATTIQAVESPSVGAESSETSELQVDDSAVPQEVHRQSSIQEGESSAILSSQPTTCGSKSEDPVTPRRKDEKDQLSQLLPVLNGGLMKLIRYVEREVSDASQTNPLVVDVNNEQEAIALMSFLPYVLGKGALVDDVNSVSATKPLLIVAASAPSLLKLKIMLGQDSFVANIMKCSKDAGPYSVRVVPRHASKPRDVVLAGTYHYRCLRRDFCSALIIYESNILNGNVARQLVLHFRARAILVQTPQVPAGNQENLEHLCPINVRSVVQQIPFLHEPTAEVAAASAAATSESPKGSADVQLVTLSPSATDSASLPIARHHSDCTIQETPVEKLLPPSKCTGKDVKSVPSHGHIDVGLEDNEPSLAHISHQSVTDRRVETQASKFSFFGRKCRGSDAKDRKRDLTGTVKDGHVSSSDVQGRSWKCLFSCFRRNSRDIDETAEAH